jgi:hypothetical protein
MKTAIACVIAVGALALGQAAMAATATTTKAWQYAATTLAVDNLMGEVTVERGTGPGFHVTATVTAGGATDAEARKLADAIQFRTHDAGKDSRLQVIYPVDGYDRFYHAGAKNGWSGSSSVEYLGRKVRLTGDPSRGADVRVDLKILAPAEATLKVSSNLGNATATGFAGRLTLDTASGTATSRGGTGEATLDTGSGAVEVAGHTGNVAADTGSGSVTIADCRCRIDADTGSGSVSILRGEGNLRAETGSGNVSVTDFKGAVAADTGSGDVSVTGLSSVPEISADTGSGDVRVQGDLSSVRRLKVDTGSGDVSFTMTKSPSLELVIDTGSGGVNIDAPAAQMRRDESGRFILRFGEGAGTGMIDTGSGSVELHLVSNPNPGAGT